MTFSLRRLAFTIIFVLIIGATAIIATFLATFDLNNFRVDISDSLSARLSQPVNLGKAHFSIKHGPSFAFDNVLIGTRDASLHLTAEHVFFRLEVLPLLTGDFKFNEILFEKPDAILKIGQDKNATKSGQRLFVDQSLVAGDLIRSIRIKDGNFRVEDYRNSDKPFIIALENLRMVVDDLSLRQSGWIDVQGDINCNNIRSPLRLRGYIKAGDSSPFWNNAHYELEMRIDDFASDLISQRYSPSPFPVGIYGRTNIHLQLSGTPAEGLKFNSTLSGIDLGITLPRRTEPILSREISAAGIWQNVDQFHNFSELNVQFGNMKFFGGTSFNLAEDDPEIRMQFGAPGIAMTDLNLFLDTQEAGQESDQATFNDGTFNLKAFNFSGPASSLSSPDILLGIKKLDLEILKGDLTYGEKLELIDCYSEVSWDAGKLAIKKFKVQSKGLLFNSSGEFLIAKDKQTQTLRLTGKSNLNIKNLISPRTILPEAGLDITLHLGATHKDGIWRVRDNLLALPSIKMLVQGQWDRKTTKTINLEIKIPEFNLTDLPLLSPAIRAIQPEGKMAASIHFVKEKGSPQQLYGAMNLVDVHFNIPGPLAPLDSLNGTIDFTWPHLDGQNLVAQLGESPIILGLAIPDLTRPKVDLEIKSKSIRADELIFRSEKQFLRDVDAKISITDEALLLGPIHTRMDRGTNVTVNGIIDNFPVADTHLTIEGKYGNIDEVIGLWISDQSRPDTNRKKRKQGLLEIDIKTEAGEIANLPFESSTAHISYRDRALIIHPISIKYGAGFGLGQVLVKFRDDQPPLLTMSGHLEDFDALAVYQQLLQRKGIITGKLRGDFHLEGTAGQLMETFLPSSFGAFNFEVRDGTLKKLRALSDALTIFNIYPLFTSSGKERGVPFDSLKGTARIDNGLLQTGNTFMTGDVMNVSLSGTQNLISSEVDLEMGIMPLRTIDRLVTKIPLAGWILTGENKALVTAHFKLTGPADDPKITAIPIESASKQVVGIFKRIFTLPVKIVTDIGEAIE